MPVGTACELRHGNLWVGGLGSALAEGGCRWLGWVTPGGALHLAFEGGLDYLLRANWPILRLLSEVALAGLPVQEEAPEGAFSFGSEVFFAL